MNVPNNDTLELSQKRLWWWVRNYKISAEGLRIEIKTPFRHTIKKLTFDEIGRQIVMSEWINLRFYALFFLIFCLGFYLSYIFFDWEPGVILSLSTAFISTIFSSIYRTYPTSSITLAGGSEPVTFYLNTPDAKTFNDFVQGFLSKHKNYMLEQYIPLNLMLSYEYQYDNIMWLKEKQFITDEEGKYYKNQLDSIFEPEETELFPFSLN